MTDSTDFIGLSDAESAGITGGVPWLLIYKTAAEEWDSVIAGLKAGYRTART